MSKCSSWIRFLFLLGWCLGTTLATATTPEKNQDLAERVNLALRQVGHQLLSEIGDTQSTVPPVALVGASTYQLYLNHQFNYDDLPPLLEQAFRDFSIDQDYRVMVRTCAGNEIILGYQQRAFRSGDIPCIGREQAEECSYINVTLQQSISTGSVNQTWQGVLLGVVLGLLLGFGVLRWRKKSTEALAIDSTIVQEDLPLDLGQFRFDYQNQLLHFRDQKQTLTFRENKLLLFLSRHRNQVVPREAIAAEVWEDEGVIVGRSLDVFISRLRKHLKPDDTIAIKNIHGVGYRLEIKKA